MGLIEFATAIYQGCKFDLLAEIIEEGAEWVKERVKTFVTNIRINERYTALLPRLDGLLADKTFADALAKDITTAIGKNTKGAGLSSSLFQKFLLQRSATFETYVNCFPSCQTLSADERASIVAFLNALNEEVLNYHRTHTLTTEHQTLVAVIADTLEKRLGSRNGDTLATLSAHLFPLPEVCPVCGSLRISHGNGEGVCDKGHRFSLKMDEKVAALIRDVETSHGSDATLTSLGAHIVRLEGIAGTLGGLVDRFGAQLDRLEGELSGSRRKRRMRKSKNDVESDVTESETAKTESPPIESKNEDTKGISSIDNPKVVKVKLLVLAVSVLLIALALIIFPDTFFGTPGLVYEPIAMEDGIGYTVVGYEGDDASVTIPMFHNFRRVKVIGVGAFRDCDSLTEVRIPITVTEIGDSAFFGCDSLTEVKIPHSVKEIHEAAFKSCDNLKSVYFDRSSYWTVYRWSESLLPPKELDDPATAARYLTERYGDYWWTRGE